MQTFNDGPIENHGGGFPKDTPQSNTFSEAYKNKTEEQMLEVAKEATKMQVESQSNTDWREEFEQKFGRIEDVTGFYDEHTKEIIKLSKEKKAIRDFISQLLEAEKKRWVEAFLEKAKLTENPIEDGYGGLEDGSYYQIYKGEFDAVLQKLS